MRRHQKISAIKKVNEQVRMTPPPSALDYR